MVWVNDGRRAVLEGYPTHHGGLRGRPEAMVPIRQCSTK